MHQLPYPSTASNPLPQPQHLEQSSRPSEENPFYVNAKQFNRILKRRAARKRLEERWKCTPERKSYLYESRHKHIIRRPRGLRGKFLKEDELERSKQEVHNSTTVRCQILRTGPNINHSKDESADSVADVPTKDERRKRTEKARKGIRDKEPHQTEA